MLKPGDPIGKHTTEKAMTKLTAIRSAIATATPNTAQPASAVSYWPD
jgi:hypothetical protein